MTKPTIFQDSEAGLEYRVADSTVEMRAAGSERPWLVVPTRALLRYELRSPIWDWLRAQGIRRPSPASDTPESARSTVQVKVRISHEAATALEYASEVLGKTKSELVAHWARVAAHMIRERERELDEKRDLEDERKRAERQAQGEELDLVDEHYRRIRIRDGERALQTERLAQKVAQLEDAEEEP